MVEAWALRDKEYAVLFKQRRVSDSKDCGEETKGTDCFMNIVLLHRGQVAQARKEARVIGGLPEGRRGCRSICCLVLSWRNARL